MVGLRRFGVSPGGCYQPELLAQLNQQVGNEPSAQGLELALGTFSFVVPQGVALGELVVAFGPWARVLVGRTRLLNGYANRLFADQVVTVSVERGARAYFAFGGGVVGAAGTVLAADSEVELGPWSGQRSYGVTTFAAPTYELTAVGGDPRFAWIFGPEFTVSPHSDRVGVRLSGASQKHTLELPSRPATMGTVQVTPNGELIVFGPDGPTIGGYPQAATLIQASFAVLAQLRAGDKIRFRSVVLGAILSS